MMAARPRSDLDLSPTVRHSLLHGEPVVALESTVIAQGLPYPDNIALAKDLEQTIYRHGATPATIGVIGGRPVIGLTEHQIANLASSPEVRKVAPRDLAIVVGTGGHGATTVASTMVLANLANIKVLSTGGIGGVHRQGELTMDISADLPTLASLPMVVVCSGPKTLVDAALTMEWLETYGVPVIGYQTDNLPLFYLASSHLPVNHRAESTEEIARIALSGWRLGLRSAILVTVPAPPGYALPEEEINEALRVALAEANSQGIKGARLTPFVLARLRQLTSGKSLTANLALLKNNAALSAEIAIALRTLRRQYAG